MAVFLTTTAIGLVYYAAGYPDGPTTIGLFVATYTLTAQGDGRRSLRLAAAGIAVLAVGWLLPRPTWSRSTPPGGCCSGSARP